MTERPRAKLIVREPGIDMVTVFLDKASVVLGREAGCDALLHTPYVSRRHAIVETIADAHYISDLGSTNGTAVNGADIDCVVRLNHGDEITLSNVHIWYMLDVSATDKTPTMPEPATPKIDRAGLLLSLDEDSHRVWIEEKNSEVFLAPLEFKLVQFLFSRGARVATREEIGAAVWGEGAFDNDTLYRLVDRVKAKIEPDPSQPKFLISHRGLGYSLNPRRPQAQTTFEG